MIPFAYYNEIDPYCVQWLKNLIEAGLIPDGIVDDRSIADVQPDDLDIFDQCHFFAGLGGWAYAARLAGWPDGRKLWTGSCPCQPWSTAGKGKGVSDARHLWPEWVRLIRAVRPSIVVGEQVSGAVGKGWLDGVADDMEGEGYAFRATIVPACALGAPHERRRVWFVAEPNGQGEHAGAIDAEVACVRPALADTGGNGWEQGTQVPCGGAAYRCPMQRS